MLCVVESLDHGDQGRPRITLFIYTSEVVVHLDLTLIFSLRNKVEVENKLAT